MKKIFYSIIALAAVCSGMTSCSDVPAPYDIPQPEVKDVIAPTGDGTQANPYNVAAIDSILDSGFSTDDSPNNPFYYIKGIICSRPSITTSYGNATYYISDDGTSGNQFYIYRSLSYNGAKFTSTDDLQYGDTVVVYTQVYSYSGTYETRSGVCQLVSRNGSQKGGGGGGGSSIAAKGSGTESDPYNVAGIIKYTSALAADTNSDTEQYFTGIVTSFKSGEEPGNSYGNATFYIKDSGGSDTFYCFRVYGPDNEKFTSASQLEVGDSVLIKSTVVNYKGNTPETVSGKGYVVKIVKAQGGGGGDTPTPTPTSAGVNIDGTTVTLVNGSATAGTETVTVDLNTLGLANAAEAGTVTLSDGSTIVFDKGTNSMAPKFYTATKGVRVYGSNTVTFNGMKTISRIVMTCDEYNGTKYVGQTSATVTFNGNTAVYTNAGSGTTQLRVQTITIYY